MVVHKRKKVTKWRGKTTHGGGARKKRRGAGSRGGRGNAGTGKRAGQSKIRAYKEGRVLGKKGFVPKHVSKINAINVGYFTTTKINRLIEQGKVSKEGVFYVVDCAKLGYNKLLGTGNTTLKLKISITRCTPSAEEKIKAAGGQVIGAEVSEDSDSSAEEKEE